ncbi:MAG: DUF4197 domain-containing protein [Flavobacteriales bacterium]|nr:DUF4197 domain-containing protein [Flavobacteriales bacterium]
MKKLVTIGLSALLVGCSSSQDLQSLVESAGQVLSSTGSTGLSNEEVINGLKQALEVGTRRAVEVTGTEGGFWDNASIRIPFPEDAEQMKRTLNDIGLNKPVEDFERTMNEAAENAVKEAVPVFVDAIKGMSIEDGFAILRGGENAATLFLRERTGPALEQRFRPIVENATRSVALTSYWTPVANAYNTASLLTGMKAVDPDLDAYVTGKAIDGLFLMLADEEKKIRRDPVARTTELLQRVFGSL